MPTIRNLTKQLLHLHRIGREIEPESSLDVTAEELGKLAGHPLLDGVPAYPEPEPAYPEPEPDKPPVAPAVTAPPAAGQPPTSTTGEGDETK